MHVQLVYGKKLGLPQYSSHNFSVQLTTECANLTDVRGEVERIYSILQNAVDSQIVHPGYIPGDEVRVSSGKTASGCAEVEKTWRCSEKQHDLIKKIIEEGQIDPIEVEEISNKRFGLGLPELNKLQASGLIDELLARTGRLSRKESSGRVYQRRRAA